MNDGDEFGLNVSIPEIFLCSIICGDVGVEVLLEFGYGEIHLVDAVVVTLLVDNVWMLCFSY